MPNTLIFCFDGTDNNPEDVAQFASGDSITNIFKLHAMFGGNLVNSSTLDLPNDGYQRSFYYSGVGTYGNFLQRSVNAVFAPSNFDVKRITDDAKEDLLNYHTSDSQVLVFGFSRGAAIARRFAFLLWRERRIPVKFLGVFDTVASISGIAFNPYTRPHSVVTFEDGALSPGVQRAVHLVALDERRTIYQPTLFNADPRVLEVWFPGAHADVGGGFWFDGLSDLALRFMIEKIQQRCGDRIILLDPNNAGDNEKINYLGLRNEKSAFNVERDDLAMHPISYGRSHEQSGFTQSVRPTLQPLYQRLVCINEEDRESLTQVPIVHWSVAERFAGVIDYRPIALRGRKYRVMDRDGSRSEIMTGIHDLRTFSGER